MRRLGVAAVWLLGVADAQELKIALAKPAVLMERLQAGEVSNKQRQATIAGLFKQVGCDPAMQPVDRWSANVICELPGETRATIIVGGHIDFIDRGQGIVDDWSGASMLVSLYQALKSEPRSHTFRFVGFTQEERGLIGSSLFVKKLASDRLSEIRAFVNLECLGLSGPKIWIHRSTPALIENLMRIANAIHVPVEGVNVDRVGDDDTHPFFNRKVPVISIHSVTQATLPILHSYRDNMRAIHPDAYYDAYRLVAFYLAFLDVRLDREGQPETHP